MANSKDMRGRIKGRSKGLLDAIRRLERVARVHRIPVLVMGDTGTGKELAARLTHERSRRQGQFVAFNCATVPKDLMESELFGYVRGAFSGAHRDHPGLFEQADGGTLFLDEIGEMPAEMQAKVLRAIQEGEVRRVGDTRLRKVDVRIVSATHRDLEAAVEAGEFREDLLYRLRGYVVSLPPLRDRGRDVVLLARDALRGLFPTKRLGRDAETALLSHDWPGNIRELQNVVLAAAVDAGRTIQAKHVRSHMVDGSPPTGPTVSRVDAILAAVDTVGAAAPASIRDATGLSRSTLRRALSDLLASGVLARVGENRSVMYRRAEQIDATSVCPRHRLIIRHIEDAGRITRQEAAEATGASLRTASRDLADLVEQGIAVADGRVGNAAGYVLAGGLHPSVSPGPQAHSRHLLEEADHDH